jgi:hypothetical protein
VRRIQIHVDEALDRAAAAEAARRGVSKAALIRTSLERELDAAAEADQADPWDEITGWIEGPPVEDIDEVIYGRDRS